MNTPTTGPAAGPTKQQRHATKMREAGFVRFETWIRPHDKAAVQAFIADLERRQQLAKGK